MADELWAVRAHPQGFRSWKYRACEIWWTMDPGKAETFPTRERAEAAWAAFIRHGSYRSNWCVDFVLLGAQRGV